MGVDRGNDHKDRCEHTQNRQQDIFDKALFAVHHDDLDKHGNIQRIDGDDGKFGRIEAEETEQRRCMKIGTIEIEDPEAIDQQGNNGGIQIGRASCRERV